MCLLDTTDGVLMLGAYGWAFVKPVRKLYYNLNITLVSVLVAVFVGTIEALSIVGPQLGYRGGLWDVVARISDNFGLLGGAIVGLFVLSWLVSTAFYKLRRYDELELPAGDVRIEQVASRKSSADRLVLGGGID
jgi:high-affinity nickel-transport protein